MFAEASRRHQQQDLAGAASCYRQVLQAQPAHADALHQLGALLVQQHGAEQYEEALRLVQAAIQLAPSNPRYRRSLGVVHEAAQRWQEAADAYERAAAKQPGDTQSLMSLARVLKAAGRPGRAAEAYRAVARLQPDHPTAHLKLGSALRKLGQHQGAVEAYRRHLAVCPGHAQAAFWLAALTADPGMAACPPQVVADLFDGYCDHFDDHLLGKLHYKTPSMLMDSIIRAASGCSSSASSSSSSSPCEGSAGASPQRQRTWPRCVDLGCGTGLMGPLLRPHALHLAGVDLSQGMVAKARQRGCYDELAVGELVQHLHAAAAAVAATGGQPYDLLVAADVCVYLGDLQPMLAAAAAAATDRALFAFSTEALPQPCAAGDSGDAAASSASFALQPTGRYKHAPAYLQQAASAAGWRVLLLEEAEIRQNAGAPIWGSLCVLEHRA